MRDAYIEGLITEDTFRTIKNFLFKYKKKATKIQIMYSNIRPKIHVEFMMNNFSNNEDIISVMQSERKISLIRKLFDEIYRFDDEFIELSYFGAQLALKKGISIFKIDFKKCSNHLLLD